MSYDLTDVAPHQIPLVRFKNEAPDASKLKANSVILDSFSASGKTYLKIVVDGALLDPVAALESTIATLKGNPSADFDSLEKIEGKINGIQSILNSNDVNLDTVQEIVNFIKNVQTEIDSILINDLTTGGITKALTAEQGKVLKQFYDALNSSVLDIISREKFVKKTASATLTLNERKVYGVITSAATLTIPTLGSAEDGIEFSFLNRDDSTATLTISGNGINIDGVATLDLAPGESAPKVVYDHSATKFFTVY